MDVKIGEGTTTLDWLVVAYPWLKEIVEKAEAYDEIKVRSQVYAREVDEYLQLKACIKAITGDWDSWLKSHLTYAGNAEYPNKFKAEHAAFLSELEARVEQAEAKAKENKDGS